LLAAGSTPYRQPLILGRAVAVYFASQPPTLWPAHSYRWLKIALHLGFANVELHWSESGRQRKILLCGEQVCFFGPGEVHHLHWRIEAPMVWIFVDSEYLQQIGFKYIQNVTCVELTKLVRRDLSILRLAELFYEACRAQTKSVPLYIEAKGTLLATRLLRAQFAPEAPPSGRDGLNFPALQKVLSYVQGKLAVPGNGSRHVISSASREELSNVVLARVAGMSEYHFIREFRKRMKKTPQEYVMQCRLDKAEELIVTQHYSPKEAAYAAGFCEPGHFYRRFRQRYGQSPHDLRKQSGS